MTVPIPKPKETRALQRFEVICYIKNLQQQGIPLAECLRSACSRPWPEPDGVYYSARTMENWWYDYARSGYKGLEGKLRRVDAGKSRVLDEETGLWIMDRIKENPRTPLRVLYRHWQGHGHHLPSLTSLYRFLKSHGCDRRSLKSGRLETGPQKAFEAPAPNDLWMADFACGPILRTVEAKALSTHLCVLMDDHSRLIVFGAYYSREDTASFLHALKEAVLRHGIPQKLYTDQGKPFVNHHVRIVCANLGI